MLSVGENIIKYHSIYCLACIQTLVKNITQFTNKTQHVFNESTWNVMKFVIRRYVGIRRVPNVTFAYLMNLMRILEDMRNQIIIALENVSVKMNDNVERWNTSLTKNTSVVVNQVQQVSKIAIEVYINMVGKIYLVIAFTVTLIVCIIM